MADVLTDADVGLSSPALSDADVGLAAKPPGLIARTLSPQNIAGTASDLSALIKRFGGINPNESIVPGMPKPEDIPQGTGPVSIPASIAGRTAAGIGQFVTSPSGAAQSALLETPAAPVMLLKWAYDAIKGGTEDAASVVGQKAYEAINKGIINANKLPAKPYSGMTDAEFAQRLGQDAVNIVGGGLMAHQGIGKIGGIPEAAPTVKPAPKPPVASAQKPIISIGEMLENTGQKLPTIEPAKVAQLSDEEVGLGTWEGEGGSIQDVRPAIKTMDDKLVVGEKGDKHNDIIESKDIDPTKMDKRTYAEPDGKGGWMEVTPDELKARGVPAAGPEAGVPQRPHSTDLREVQKNEPTPPSTEPVPQSSVPVETVLPKEPGVTQTPPGSVTKDVTETGKAQAKAQKQVTKVAKAEGQRPAKEVKAELVARLEEAMANAPEESPEIGKLRQDYEKALRLGRKSNFARDDLAKALDKAHTKVTIDIPGDGTFTVWNTKRGLADVLARAKRLDTSSSKPAPVRYSGISKADREWIEQQKAAQPKQEPPQMVGMGGALEGEVKPGAGADIYGIAQRVREQRTEAGQVGEVKPGQGIAAPDSVELGRQLIAGGSDPEKALSDFEKTKRMSSDDMAVVRAHGESLSKAARNIEQKFGTESQEFLVAQKALTDWDERSKTMQTEWHKTGQAQQGETDIDTGTFSGLQRAYMADTGKDFTDKQATTAKDIAKKVAKANVEVDEAKDRLYKNVGQEPTVEPHIKLIADRIKNYFDNRATAALKRLQGATWSLSPQVLADLTDLGVSKILAKGIEAGELSAEWSKDMIDAVGDRIKPYLKNIWDRSHKAINDHIEKTVDPGAQKRVGRAVRKAKAISGDTAESARQAFKDYKPGSAMSPEQVKTLWHYAQRHYLDQGEDDFTAMKHGIANDLGLSYEDVNRGLLQPKGAKRMSDEMYTKMAERRRLVNSAKYWLKDQKIPGWVRFLKKVPRAFFIDKVFGHGTVGMVTHAGINVFDPVAWKTYWPTFLQQFKLVVSPAYHERVMQDLLHDPLFTKARRAGLANDPYRYTDDYQGAFQGFFGKLGLSGNRGFDALKIFRQKQFNQRWNALDASLKTPEMAQFIADSVNHATGVVKMPFREWAGWTFFAPKLEGSRWAWMIGDTAKTAKTLGAWDKATPEDRIAALSDFKQKARIAGTYFGLLAINQGILSSIGSNQKINITDPRKGDFMAFKVGGYNLGIVSPMIGIVRLFANLSHAAFGKRGQVERLTPRAQEFGEIGEQYLRGKLSPFAGFTTDIASQADFQGRPLPFSSDKTPAWLRREGYSKYTWGEYLGQQLAPIPVEEALKEVWRDQGMTESDMEKYLRAMVTAGAMGATGARLSEDVRAERPQTNSADPFQYPGAFRH